PRHEALERARARAGRRGDRDGLRDREDASAVVAAADRDRPDHGHGAVHVARTSSRPGGRLPYRPLFARRDDVRVARRRHAVRRQHALRDHDEALVEPAEAAEHARRRAAGGGTAAVIMLSRGAPAATPPPKPGTAELVIEEGGGKTSAEAGAAYRTAIEQLSKFVAAKWPHVGLERPVDRIVLVPAADLCDP